MRIMQIQWQDGLETRFAVCMELTGHCTPPAAGSRSTASLMVAKGQSLSTRFRVCVSMNVSFNMPYDKRNIKTDNKTSWETRAFPGRSTVNMVHQPFQKIAAYIRAQEYMPLRPTAFEYTQSLFGETRQPLRSIPHGVRTPTAQGARMTLSQVI